MPNLTPRFGLKKPLGTESASVSILNENADILDADAAKKTDLDMHTANTSNPHAVTHAQTNPQGAVSGTGTTKNKHISDQDFKNWEDHRTSTSNPHGTTAAQVGALPAGGTAVNSDKVDGLHLRNTNGFLEYSSDGVTWKGAGGVKSVQRGTTAVGAAATVNVTISAVDMNKTMVNILTQVDNTGSFTAKLTSSTNLQLIDGGNASAPADISWEVIEFA